MAGSAVQVEDDILLPTGPERAWVLQQLAALSRVRGFEHLVLAPLLTPEDRFFPDRWSGDAASLRRLMQRLLVYADLDATVELTVHAEDDVGGPVAPAGIGAPTWLVRLQGKTVHVAARASTLRDPPQAVASAARTVAEAFRAWHRLRTTDELAEQRLVDLTAVFLGFGVLTTAASVRHGATRTPDFRVQRTKTQLGVTTPQTLAFALAAQLLARGASTADVRAVGRHLQPNQAAFLRAALQILGDGARVRATLELPEPAQWPAAPSLAELTAPLVEPTEAAPEPAPATPDPAERGVLGMNEGRPVFRVERSKAYRLARMFGLPVVLLGMLAGQFKGVEVEMWAVVPVAAGLALLGLLVGRFLPDVRCSEPKCSTSLRPTDTVCPRCKGTISGTIRHPRERLGAEEALQRSSATAPPG